MLTQTSETRIAELERTIDQLGFIAENYGDTLAMKPRTIQNVFRVTGWELAGEWSINEVLDVVADARWSLLYGPQSDEPARSDSLSGFRDIRDVIADLWTLNSLLGDWGEIFRVRTSNYEWDAPAAYQFLVTYQEAHTDGGSASIVARTEDVTALVAGIMAYPLDNKGSALIPNLRYSGEITETLRTVCQTARQFRRCADVPKLEPSQAYAQA